MSSLSPNLVQNRNGLQGFGLHCYSLMSFPQGKSILSVDGHDDLPNGQ